MFEYNTLLQRVGSLVLENDYKGAIKALDGIKDFNLREDVCKGVLVVESIKKDVARGKKVIVDIDEGTNTAFIDSLKNLSRKNPLMKYYRKNFEN